MTLDDYMKKVRGKTEEKETKSYRKSLIKRTLLTITIVLIILITCNMSKPAKKIINKYIFETNYNFSKINSLYKKYLLDIKEKTGIKDKTTPVNGNKVIEYTNIKEYKNGAELTVDDNYNVKMLESGLIIFIGEKEDYGNSVVVQQSNGIDVTYGNITIGDIKVYDYVEKGTILGTSNKKLYLEFAKDGETLDYKTYIK
jgi:stage IV sporulation protein FA